MQYATFNDWFHAENMADTLAADLRETRTAIVQAIRNEIEGGNGDAAMLALYAGLNNHYNVNVADSDKKGFRAAWSVKFTRVVKALAKADPYWKGRTASVVKVDDGIALTFPIKSGTVDLEKVLRGAIDGYLNTYGPDKTQREVAEVLLSMCDDRRSLGLAAELAAGCRRMQSIDEDAERGRQAA